MISFDNLRNANTNRQQEWLGNEKADIAFRTLEVGGEVGELLEKVKKFLRKERGIYGSTATVEEIAEEMGDCVIALDLLAEEFGISLGEVVVKKFNQTSKKYNMKTRL